jgi:hypothetical protein
LNLKRGLHEFEEDWISYLRNSEQNHSLELLRTYSGCNSLFSSPKLDSTEVMVMHKNSRFGKGKRRGSEWKDE